ncbi:MAG: putative DNA binding domain-containing protein [Candidatus Methanoplasma sp.]|nr:putative DNA binding domain-containing protein [Candidatus Methanoplasma sp.]
MERQNLEWKESWREEHMETICAFANASGGVMEIGRSDDGRIVGLRNAKKLLEDIPNKIRSVTGIVPAVDLLESDGMQYISISVGPHVFPVSCRGRYYVRSGSTTQELSGIALDEFMLRILGKTWDGVPLPHAKFADFESDGFKYFRRMAVGSGRLTAEDLAITDEVLLDNLMLTEGEYMKRAAPLLFHQVPDRWAFGAHVKIGMFENAHEILYQDEVRGPLISIADRVVDLVYLKYFKGLISYRGIQRIEDYPVPKYAFREAVQNAVIHRDYSTGNPIHIHIYPNEVLIYNDGGLPEGWTVDKLFSPHTSKPRNPLIANAFSRSGQIEAWGRGIEKMVEDCREWNKPDPFYRISPNEVMIGFKIDPGIGNSIGNSIGESDGLNQTQSKIVQMMIANPTISAKNIGREIGIALRNVELNISDLKERGMIDRVGSRRGGSWIVKIQNVPGDIGGRKS